MLPPPPDPPVLDTSDLSTSSDSIGNGGYSSFLGSTNNGHYQRVPQPCPDPDPIGTVGMGDITGSPDYLDSNDNQQFVDHTSSCSPVNSDSWGDPSKILDSLQAETTTGDDTASSTSESDVTQIWVPAANQVPGRHDSHSQLGNGSWSMDLPQGILKQSSSGLTPHESSPKNAVSSGSTPTEIGNGSDVGSDNMTSVSATGIGSRSSLVKKKVVHSLPKNNTVLRYDPSTGLTEAVIVGSEDEDEKRDAPNGDSGIGQDCEDDSTRHLAKFDSEPSSPSFRRRPSRPPPTARELLFDSIMANLSGIYGLLLIVMGAVIPISEVFSKPHPFLFEGFYFYLFGMSILFLLYAYVYILHTRTLGGMTKFRKSDDNMHYRMRYKIISDTGSFYLRLGAVGFGIGSMIKSGLQFGEFFELDFRSPCINILQRLLPILHLTFTFAQLYFVFLNSKMCIQSYKAIARFGLMHMVGTNLSVWCRELVKETIREINEHMSLKKGATHTMPEAEPLTYVTAGSGNGSEYSFNPDNGDLSVLVSSVGGINTSVNVGPDIVNDPQCLETSLMSKVVEDAAPYLYPCSIQYSLICAGILYTMWTNIGKRLLYQSSDEESQREAKVRSQKLSVDCSSSSRGLFMGIFLLVSAVISMIVFFMLINKPSYMDAAIQLEHLSQVVLNVIAAIALILAFIRMRELRFTAKEELSLEEILLIISLPGEYIFGFLSIIAIGVEGIDQSGLIILLSSVLAMFESSLQTMFILNGMRRSAHTPQLQKRKTGREFITFLMVCNIAMWGVNTFEIHRSEFNPAQMRFYGVLAWNIFTHIAIPLIIFFRFHSTVCLSNIWKHAWKRKSNSQESLTNAGQ